MESREEEKLAKEKAWRPQLREDGPAAEAYRRLHHGTQRKEEELLRIRDKYGKEFASMAPFSPSLSERGSPVPRKKFQDWVRDQEAWRTTRDEKRAERVKGQAEEEANYFKQHSVHRELSNKDMTKATKAVDRLYSSHKKSEEKIEKLRSEKMQQEMEHIQQASVHRRVDTPDASEKIQKVQSSINRLYHQDVKKRQKWFQEQADAKIKSDQEIEEQILRDSLCMRGATAATYQLRACRAVTHAPQGFQL